MHVRLIVTLVILALITPLLWMTYSYAAAYQLYGSTAVAMTFRIATAVAAGALFVLVAVRVLFRPLYAWAAQQPPTHLQVGVAITVATFIAVAAALAWFGVDLSTILTTSALVTAIVGLSIQPLLGSLMSGLALQRTIRIGDGIVLSGNALAVTSLDWRSVVVRRADGATMIIPNSKLAHDAIEVLSRDEPARASIAVEVPASIAPHRIREAIIPVASGIDSIDAGRAVDVMPRACRFDGTATHDVSFWVSRFDEARSAEAKMLRRSWYALRRNGIVAAKDGPASAARDGAREGDDSAAEERELIESLRGSVGATDIDLATLPPDFLSDAVRNGMHLHYDDGERIVLPARAASDLCLLAAGRIELVDAAAAVRPRSIANPAPSTPWSVERALARRIGPYAAVVVREAIAGGASIVAVCHAGADEIDDPAERAAFLAEVLPPPRSLRVAGTVFRARRNPSGMLAHDPPARAVDHAHVIVVADAP